MTRRKLTLVTTFLKVFLDTTEVFSGSKYPTSNLYFKKIWTIRSLLAEEVASGDEVVKILALQMQKKFIKYWDECNKILSIASVLDPRSKLAYIEYTYAKVFGDEVSRNKVSELRCLFHEIYDQYERAANQKEVVVDSSTCTAT